jgi:hypothetical protein
MRVLITARSERREAVRGVRTAAVRDEDLGTRTFAIDLELDALGTVQGRGYDLEPRRAKLVAWWESSKI